MGGHQCLHYTRIDLHFLHGQLLTLFQCTGQQNLSLNTQPTSLKERGCESVGMFWDGEGNQLNDGGPPHTQIIPSIKVYYKPQFLKSIKLGNNNTYFKELF